MNYLLLISLQVVAAFSPGAGASIDMASILEAKCFFASYVLNCIKKVELPDYTYEQGHVNHNSFAIISKETCEDMTIKADPSVNGIQMSIKNICGQFHSNNLVEKLSVMNAKGSVLVDFCNISISLKMSVTS